MGNFAENLNLGNRFRPPPLQLVLMLNSIDNVGKVRKQNFKLICVCARTKINSNFNTLLFFY